MWWQVLPPLGIMGGCLAVIFAGGGTVHYIFTGRPTDRGLTECTYFAYYQKNAYRRDTFMVGNEYEGRGLDYIPDE